MINKNLKKCAALPARPAIQYVLIAINQRAMKGSQQDSHSGNDDVRDEPQWDYIKDESRQQPRRGTIVAAGPLPEEEGSELHEVVQCTETRKCDQCALEAPSKSAQLRDSIRMEFQPRRINIRPSIEIQQL